jgi:hypothetical protein
LPVVVPRVPLHRASVDLPPLKERALRGLQKSKKKEAFSGRLPNREKLDQE